MRFTIQTLKIVSETAGCPGCPSLEEHFQGQERPMTLKSRVVEAADVGYKVFPAIDALD